MLFFTPDQVGQTAEISSPTHRRRLQGKQTALTTRDVERGLAARLAALHAHALIALAVLAGLQRHELARCHSCELPTQQTNLVPAISRNAQDVHGLAALHTEEGESERDDNDLAYIGLAEEDFWDPLRAREMAPLPVGGSLHRAAFQRTQLAFLRSQPRCVLRETRSRSRPDIGTHRVLLAAEAQLAQPLVVGNLAHCEKTQQAGTAA